MVALLKHIRFEYKISAIYLLAGGAWILFSDNILLLFVEDISSLSVIQTYKGWFYIAVTASLLFSFLRTHLKKLRHAEHELIIHQRTMEEVILEKTQKLDVAIKDLSLKNQMISSQNIELKSTLEDLKKTQVQLLQVEKMASLGVLTTGLAHEINNPLNYIMWGLTGFELLLQERGETPKNAMLYISSVREGVNRITKIVESFNYLNFRESSLFQKYDIENVIESSLAFLNMEKRDDVTILKNYSKNTHSLDCNIGQLQYVFVNLFQNAMDAFRGKGRIEITIAQKDNKLEVKIGDNGIGISEENLSKVTDPFFTTKAPGEGLGLALSIALNIIISHDGVMHFDSSVNKGTIVTLIFPIKNI